MRALLALVLAVGCSSSKAEERPLLLRVQLEDGRTMQIPVEAACGGKHSSEAEALTPLIGVKAWCRRH